MKKVLFIIAIAISLMSTKCAEKQFNITIENKSGSEVVFSHTKDIDSLKSILSKGNYFRGQFIRLDEKSTKTDTLIESDLYFYLSKEKSFYTFYFLKLLKEDHIKGNYVFEKKYDSINIEKDKIIIGEEVNNAFIYSKSKILFKSK
jgi:hypothetical protein